MIRHQDSHLDHGLTEAQVAYILERYAGRDAFFIDSFELPDDLGTAECRLRGPCVGDPPVPSHIARQEKRGTRSWTSRVVDMPPTRTRWITVVAGPHGDQPCVLYTAYGGPAAPREPLDPELVGADADASNAFWSAPASSNAVGAMLGEMLAESGVDDVSFALFLVDKNANISYVANADRARMLNQLSEFMIMAKAADGPLRDLLYEAFLAGLAMTGQADATSAGNLFGAWVASKTYSGTVAK